MIFEMLVGVGYDWVFVDCEYVVIEVVEVFGVL